MSLIFLINLRPAMYICPRSKKSTPLLPNKAVKCTYLAAYLIPTRTPTEITKTGAVTKVRVLEKEVYSQIFKGI